MTQALPQCQNLRDQVESLLQLLNQESSLRAQDTIPVETALRKAIAPTFEIVFAGAFSAGKSMLINALLGRELLYSAEGHATGTECYIAYAEQNQEKVILTFLSEAEIQEQANALCQRLELKVYKAMHPDTINQLRQGCDAIIQKEGGEGKSERAKQAKALMLLLEGYEANRERIHANDNATYSMEQFNFSNLKEAAGYARRGSNSAVLKQIKYYCHHPLLQDGNVIVDTPGIDAPVQKDAERAYRKIEHPDTSAVICVLKPAAAGDLAKEETELLERMRKNPGIRDRVFYVFNRIDETWCNNQLKQRLDNLIASQFQDTTRVYKTSGLLGFYGSQIKLTGEHDRFGLDSIFAENIKGMDGREETPQFVFEFNRYCLITEKLSPIRFPIPPSVLGAASANEKYVQILTALGTPLIDQLIQHSGIEEFRTAITRYLTQEKRPQLFASLADDLQPLCISLRKHYIAVQRDLVNQPRKIEAIIAQDLQRLNQQLQQVGQSYRQHMAEEVNQVVTNGCKAFEADFGRLQSCMRHRLDELLETFSVTDTYRRATLSHSRNATAPVIAVLVEALYYLANQLEDVLVKNLQDVVIDLFQRLTDGIRKSEYYGQLYRLLGNDGGIEQQLKVLENQVSYALVNAARTECDRFVRESPQFYNETIFSIYQLRSASQQTHQNFDCKGLIEIEPAIRQLLKSDFEPKVEETLNCNFRQIINQTIKNQLLPTIDNQANELLQQHDRVRMHLGRLLRKEAEEKIANNRQIHMEVHQKMKLYNQVVFGINKCLQTMQLHGRHLPVIGDADVIPLPELEVFDNSPTSNGVGDPKVMSKAVKV